MEAIEVASFHEAEEYIYHINRFTTKNTLQDSTDFFRFLRCPGENCEIIHVAGTNGKGSVCCYLTKVLEESGRKVGLFTSPHLVTIRERFVANQKMITEEEFLEAFRFCMRKVREWRADYHPTYFELLFFMAMHWFSKKKVDTIVLETGLGGRLDTTNIIEQPRLCIITSVSMDHMEYLGDTIDKIAYEKAGIIKKDVPVLYQDGNQDVTKVIENRASLLDVRTIPVNIKKIQILNFTKKSIDFSVHTSYYGDSAFTVSTSACYQTENAALVIHACGELGIAKEYVQTGICHAHWAGRMEEVIPGVIVDGAHNEDGVRAFMQTIKQVGVHENTLLFGVVRDKDCREMIRLITEGEYFNRIIPVTVTSAGSRALDAKEIETLFEMRTGRTEHFFDNVKEALTYALSVRREGKLYIAGSLYLVGQVKQLLKEEH